MIIFVVGSIHECHKCFWNRDSGKSRKLYIEDRPEHIVFLNCFTVNGGKFEISGEFGKVAKVDRGVFCVIGEAVAICYLLVASFGKQSLFCFRHCCLNIRDRKQSLDEAHLWEDATESREY